MLLDQNQIEEDFSMYWEHGLLSDTRRVERVKLVHDIEHNHLQLLQLLAVSAKLPGEGSRGESRQVVFCCTQKFNCVEMHFFGVNL